MEFEELQAAWGTMNEELKKQKKLTDKIIMDMTKQKYKNKYSTAKTLESLASIVCFVMGFYVIVNFGKLDIWYLQVLGIFTILFYTVFPILSLNALFRLNNLDLSQDYGALMVDFNKRKKWFLLVQQLSIALCFVLVIAALPVIVKISDGKDMLLDSDTWLWYIPLAMIFLVFFTRWGYRCYKNMTNSAERILTDLE